MNQKIKYVALGIALACTGWTGASAEQVYELNPITVTAQRYEKKDVDVPATTQTFTEKDIAATGADNMSVALGYLDGVVTSGMGPNGASNSSMTSKIVMRGVENGTVVMVNGTPINWRNLYNLENIPTSAVSRVEVVHGGGAVMYGSQATGGVINIITKKKLDNQVEAGWGNRGRQSYKVSANAGSFSFAYDYNKWGTIDKVSDYNTKVTKTTKKNGKTVTVTLFPVHMQQKFRGSEKNNFNAMYQFNDKLDLLYNHNESTNRWSYKYSGIPEGNKYAGLNGQTRYKTKFERDGDFIQLNLHDMDGFSGHIFYNYNSLATHHTNFYSSEASPYKPDNPKYRSYSKEKNKTYGYDFQKVWDQKDKQTFLLGTSLVREKYKNHDPGATSALDREISEGRNIYAAFGSWNRNITPKDTFTLSGRGTWTTGGKKQYHNFSTQAQYLHKLNNNQSIYAGFGQSFVLPTLRQLHSRYDISSPDRIIGNPDLKPQKGTHYEMGWKMETEHRQYKAALFTERIKDDISFSKQKQNGQDYWNTVNEDFKNKGLELTVKGQEKNGFGWHAGFTYQNPKTKEKSQKKTAKTYWDRHYGRILLNGGVDYTKNKWETALNFSYLADRVMTPTSAYSYDTKPYLLTSFFAKYSPNKSDDIILTVDNILNREDVTSHTSSEYYSTPTTFLLSYRHRF